MSKEFVPPEFDVVKLPAMLLYARDFMNPRVQRMSAAQRGIFAALLCQSWIDEGLDPDQEALAMVACVSDEEFAECWKPPLSTAWKPGPDGRLRNMRQEKVRLEAMGERTKKAQAAWLRWHGGDAPHKQRTSGADASQCNSTQVNSTQDSPTESKGATAPGPVEQTTRRERTSRLANLNAACDKLEAPDWLRTALTGYMEARKRAKFKPWSVDLWVDEAKQVLALGEQAGARACMRASKKPWAMIVYEDHSGANAQHSASQAPSAGSWYKGPPLKGPEVREIESDIRLRMAGVAGDFMLSLEDARAMAREMGDRAMHELDWKTGVRSDAPKPMEAK